VIARLFAWIADAASFSVLEKFKNVFSDFFVNKYREIGAVLALVVRLKGRVMDFFVVAILLIQYIR
jgi:hypothetical protein